MADLDHDAWRDEAGLYALGTLAGKEREAFEAHLATCAECTAEVRALEGVVTALPYAVPQVDPPAALRARVLAAAGAPQASSRATVAQMPAPAHLSVSRTHLSVNAAWLAAAALLLLSVGLGAYALNLRERIGGLEGQLSEAVSRLDLTEQRLAEATRAAERAQMRMAVLTSPDLKQVSLKGQPAAPARRRPRVLEPIERPAVRGERAAAAARRPHLPAVVPDARRAGQRRPDQAGSEWPHRRRVRHAARHSGSDRHRRVDRTRGRRPRSDRSDLPRGAHSITVIV